MFHVGRYRWLPDCLISASCIPSTSLYNALSFCLGLSDRCWSFPVCCLFLFSSGFSLVLPWVRCVTLESCFLRPLWILHADHHSSRRGIHSSCSLPILGLECFFLIKRAFYLHLASTYTSRDRTIQNQTLWMQQVPLRWRSSSTTVFSRMDRQQESITGTEQRCASARDAGVRAHPTVPPPEKSTAPPTPPLHFTGATPTRSWELCWWSPTFGRAFLTRCSMHFSLQPRTFEREESKLAFVLTLLTGRAALWGTAVWENQDLCCASFQGTLRRDEEGLRPGGGQARTLPDFSQISDKVIAQSPTIP